MPRCQVMVNTSIYRAAGQCRIDYNIEKVKMADVEVPIFLKHRRIIEEGRKLARVTLGRKR